MASTTTSISASGRRQTTFLITKTRFRIRPSPQHSESRQTIGPYDKGFKEALWRRGVSKDNVKENLPEVVHRLRRAIDNAVKEPSSTSLQPMSLTPLPTIPPPDHFSGEDTYLTFALPLLLPSLFTLTSSHTITRNELWCNQPTLEPSLEPALTWVAPDLAYGFSAARWRQTWPAASEQLGLHMAPRKTLAFPFFLCEGKGPKGKAKVAKLQNLSSASLALRNMRLAHERAMALANAEVARDPEKHVTGLSLKVLEPRSPGAAFYSTKPTLSGNGNLLFTPDANKYTTSLTYAIEALTPYTTFHRAATVLSAIVTTETVSLDVHWTSVTPPRPLDTLSSSSPSYLNPAASLSSSPHPLPPQRGHSNSKPCYYLRHRLAKWNVRDELLEARRGLGVAIEMVGRQTEGRMGACMDVLEAAGGRTGNVKNSNRDVGMGGGENVEGEVLVAADSGFL